jgi:conjugative transfer pilus assembly protein TraH
VCDNPAAEKCLAPKVVQKKLLAASLNGTTATVDKDGRVGENIQARPKGSGLRNQVEVMLNNISERVRVDKALSPEELAFVNSTRIPILKMLSIEMAYRSGLGPIHTNEYAEAIAYDILLGYLDEIMGVVMDSLNQLQKVQVSDAIINEFRADIRHVRQELFHERTNLFHQIMLTLETMERTQQIEAKLQNAFISYQQGARGE